MNAHWYVTKDGDATLLALYRRHYPIQRKKGAWRIAQFVGPGENIVLRTDRGDAGFVWRNFIDDSEQRGVCCSFFRNESPHLSSELIRQADAVADVAWPGARHYTFVDPEAVRSTNPGFCFVAAGWRRVMILNDAGMLVPLLTSAGLQVIERAPCGGCSTLHTGMQTERSTRSPHACPNGDGAASGRAEGRVGMPSDIRAGEA